jgi:hypothetical protein
VATARFALLAPSSDSEVVHHQGGTARPTDWNRAQLGLALRGVALDGSLLPQRLTARRRGGRARGTVVDMYGHGVAGASVTLQRRVGRRWKRVSRGTTTASGTFSVRGSRRGRERVEVRIGGAIFWKAVKA